MHNEVTGSFGEVAARVDIGDEDALPGLRQRRSDFGHKVNAAEDDVFGVSLGCAPRKLQRIAPIVGKGDDVVPLVVVAQDDQPVAQRGFGCVDARRGIVHGGLIDRANLHAQVQRLDRMGERANRDEVDAGFSDTFDTGAGDVAGGFQWHAPGGDSDRFAHRVQVHIVQQDAIQRGIHRQRHAEFVQVAHLDLDR